MSPVEPHIDGKGRKRWPYALASAPEGRWGNMAHDEAVQSLMESAGADPFGRDM